MDYMGLQALRMEREALKRSLHILGNSDIGKKEIQVIVACTRALNRLDDLIEWGEGRGGGDEEKTKDKRRVPC